MKVDWLRPVWITCTYGQDIHNKSDLLDQHYHFPYPLPSPVPRHNSLQDIINYNLEF